MERNYKIIAHSSGPWKEHKYVKKIGDSYYYPQGYENGRTIMTAEEDTNARKTALAAYKEKKAASAASQNKESVSSTASSSSSKKSGSSKSSTKKIAGGKEKVPKTSSSKSSKESTSKEKETKEKETKEKETKEKETKEKTKLQADHAEVKENAKTEEESIKEAVGFEEGDSISSEKNDDGTYTVTVTYSDGSSQKFYLSKNRELMKKDPKVEKKEDELKHTVFYTRNNDGTYLIHHGVKGQKWGVRRYQNPDGTLTAEGRERIKQFASDDYAEKDFVLKKGTKFNRVGSDNEIDDDKRTYVSFTKNDKQRYIDYSQIMDGTFNLELKSLSDKGYQAMFDYNDKDAAENPLIVLNRKNSLKTTSSKKITQKDIDDAMIYVDNLLLDEELNEELKRRN